ncbi:MAG: ComEC/Rec2 family competence protein [Allorhizobium sp.]
MREVGEDQTAFALAPVGAHTAEIPLPVAASAKAAVIRRTSDSRSSARLAARLGRAPSATAAALAVEREHGRAFLWVPVCLGTGAVTWFNLERDPWPPAMVFLLVVAALAGFVSRYRHPVLTHLFFAAALFFGGLLLAGLEAWRVQTVVLDSPVTSRITGVVERRAADDNGQWRYVVAVTQTQQPALKRPPGRATLLARSRHAPFELGQTLTGLARLQPPAGPALPGLNDFAFSSYFNGIGAVGYFLGAPSLADVQHGPVRTGFSGWLDGVNLSLFALRDRISARIRDVIGGDAGAFATAIITGERRGLSKETAEALRASGLAHIIAISGIHMALAAGLFFVGLRFALSLSDGLAQAYPIKKIAAFGALLAAFSYYLISGYQVSAERAFLMMAIMLGAVILDRPAISLRNAALAAIVIIVLSPSQLMGPSFQMSFAATIALIAGYAVVKRGRFGPARPVARMPLRAAWISVQFVSGIFLTSLIGGLSTAIFAIAHFHRLAGYSLPTNLAAMPIISFLVMPSGLLAMVLMPFGLDALPLKAMGYGLDLVIAISRDIAGWGGVVGFQRLHPIILLLAIAGFLPLALLRSRLRHVGSALLTLAVFVAVVKPPLPLADVLIAEDGALVALPTADRLYTNRARPPAFIFDQWQRALQITGKGAPVMLADDKVRVKAPEETALVLTDADIDYARSAMRKMLDTVEEGHFACIKQAWCLARLKGGWRIAVVDHQAYVGPACDAADIVVTPRRVSFPACRSGSKLISANTLRQTGAVELYLGNKPAQLEGGISIKASFNGTGRPWMAHRRYDWRTGGFSNDQAQPELIVTKQPADSQWAGGDISDSGG